METKPLTAFKSNVLRRDGLQTYCKPCQKAFMAICYEKHKEKYRHRARLRRRRMMTEASRYVGDFLRSHPCVDCGESDILVLEFDHVRGKKAFTIGSNLKTFTVDLLIKEIDKCVVRCANCHRRKTAIEAGVSWRLFV